MKARRPHTPAEDLKTLVGHPWWEDESGVRRVCRETHWPLGFQVGLKSKENAKNPPIPELFPSTLSGHRLSEPNGRSLK